jgi:hypothetical protein
VLALLPGRWPGSAAAAKQALSAARLPVCFIGWLGLRRAQRRELRDPRCQPSITALISSSAVPSFRCILPFRV